MSVLLLLVHRLMAEASIISGAKAQLHSNPVEIDIILNHGYSNVLCMAGSHLITRHNIYPIIIFKMNNTRRPLNCGSYLFSN